jgi:flagellar hook-length control protein FliK
MEVSAIMSLSQFPQALNGTAGAVETGGPQSATNATARFSRLLGQCSGVCGDAHGEADPSANPMFQKVIAALQPELMQQQEPELEASKAAATDPETTAKAEQDDAPDERSAGDGVPEAAGKPAFTGFPWAQAVIPANPVVAANSAGPSPEGLAMQSSQSQETAISAVGGKALAGFVALAGLPAQNRQEQASPPVNIRGEMPGKVGPVQSAMPPLQDGPATKISEAELSGAQSGVAAKKGVDGVLTGKIGSSATSDISEVSFTQGCAANSGGVSDADGNGLQQVSNVTLQRTAKESPELEGVTVLTSPGHETGKPSTDSQKTDKPLQFTGTSAESNITIELPMRGKDAENAYRASFGEAASNVKAAAAATLSRDKVAMTNSAMTTQEENSGVVQPDKQGSKSTDQSIKPKLDVVNPHAKPELNVVDPLAKPGLKSAEPGQSEQQVESALAGEVKSSVKEAVGDLPGKGSEEKPAVIDTPNPIVHGSGEARVMGEGKVSTTVNDVKLPFAEQIQHQVREKLESGDYGLNKGSITLKLHPHELGELKINMRMEDQRLKVEIVTENHAVKEALMQNLDTLKETLSRQSITMDRFNVSADVRQGFQQGSRDGSRMMQDNRGAYTPFNAAMAAEESVIPTLHYGWESDNSLVSLVL